MTSSPGSARGCFSKRMTRVTALPSAGWRRMATAATRKTIRSTAPTTTPFVEVGQQSTESQAYDVLHVGASTSADMGAFDGGMSMEELIGQDEWRKLSDAAALLNGGRNYTAGNRKQLRLYAAEWRHSSAPAAFNADALDEGHKAFPYELGRARTLGSTCNGSTSTPCGSWPTCW